MFIPDGRPRNLDISRFHFPLNAVISGLHRITGVMLLLCLLAYLSIWNLQFIAHFDLPDSLLQTLHSIFWLSLGFHWLSGIRHLLAEHLADSRFYVKINQAVSVYGLLLIWTIYSYLLLGVIWNA
ncbi:MULTISPECIES: hypothetical protein [Thiomicrorhabdus]|uniref:Succinate dehydrogenase cytochrome b556 subunit n=1 Tax=Thiomicrorhabdus heinhorstiae TaxID=2748010 RepID=A0ABS0BSZ8_9GAMM|nr:MULTISPECIES: hypothetical protein [Thiomicrorhabdus]MBF6056970.1 hypothetical protein [Thiomicrorhabdus heinhorstiae]